MRRIVRTPVGPLTVIGGEAGLRAVLWPDDDVKRVPGLGDVPLGKHPVVDRAVDQLLEYFGGERRAFDLPLELVGTPFQLSVWRELAAIPFGRSSTYGKLAQRIGRPKAVRAVGAANGKNPVSIVLPCHRVLGSGGKLVGFAGGLETKRRLLVLEGVLPDSVSGASSAAATTPA